MSMNEVSRLKTPFSRMAVSCLSILTASLLLFSQNASAAETVQSRSRSGKIDLRNGKAIYTKYCFYCHGRKGRGDGAIGIAVKPKPIDFVHDVERMSRPDEELMKSIENGIIKDTKSRLYMPPWREVLNETERWNVLAYVRLLAKGEDNIEIGEADMQGLPKSEKETEGVRQPSGSPAAAAAVRALPGPQGMVYIPEGEFIMGTDKVDVEAMGLRFGSAPYYMNEKPQRRVWLKGYYIDKYEVTNRAYQEFVDAMKGRVRVAPLGYWKNGVYPEGEGDYPVHSVHWYAAQAYCRWRGKRLPTEAEWEKAARGIDGREYPWGNEYSRDRANNQSNFGGPIAVGKYENGKSPYGLYDMAGNVAEWVEDWYKPYPGGEGYKDPKYGEQYKVVRGGGWGGMGHYNLPLYYSTSHREKGKPTEGYRDVGFRCAK